MHEIIKKVEDLRVAMIDADNKALQRLTMDALSYGHTNGNIENKKEFIDAIVNRKNVFEWIELSNHDIYKVKNVAIVRHYFKARVMVHGVVQHPDIRVVQVWFEDNSEWKLLVRQAYKI